MWVSPKILTKSLANFFTKDFILTLITDAEVDTNLSLSYLNEMQAYISSFLPKFYYLISDFTFPSREAFLLGMEMYRGS